ncbi:MAG: hypothetical protein C0502_04795 [Opitutus sp.]|nr:hypothetical protein [Opitutus sp.]
MHSLGLINHVSAWWETLSGARQLFYGIGIVAGVASLVIVVLAFIGLEHHDATDIGATHAGDTGGIFSVKPLVGFFLGFGWAGGIAMDGGLSLLPATAVAFVTGATITAGILAIYRGIYSMRSDGTMRIEQAVGAVGTVYVTVPPGRKPGGQVTVNFAGRQETLAALSNRSLPLPSGEKIKVIAIVDGSTVQVEPL